jgi:hypothetical protein
VIEQLGIERVCLGGCGLNDYRHRGSIFLNVIHWRERRVTRRGLLRFLLLVARRNREKDPGYLNDRKFRFLYTWIDHRAADDMAGLLGIRFPVAFSRRERAGVLWDAMRQNIHLASTHPAIYAWAWRGIA